MRYFIFVFLFLANNAYAQTACPNGVAPGSPQCGPDSGTSRGEIPLPPPQPTGEWIKTWGAIVNSRETFSGMGFIGANVKRVCRRRCYRSM